MRFKKIFAMSVNWNHDCFYARAVFASSTEEQIADVQAQKEAAQAELAQQQSDIWHLWRARSRSLKAIWRAECPVYRPYQQRI